MTGKTEVLSFRLEETLEGPVVDLVTFVALTLFKGFVDRFFIFGFSEFLMTQKAETRLILAEISPPDETVGHMTGLAVFFFHRGMHNPGKEFLAHLLVTFQAFLSRRSFFLLRYTGRYQGKTQKPYNKLSSFSCHFPPHTPS